MSCSKRGNSPAGGSERLLDTSIIKCYHLSFTHNRIRIDHYL